MNQDDDIGRINARFVRGEITFNEYINLMERLAEKPETTKPQEQS